MPNCFSLSRKSKREEGPVKLSLIDDEICHHFNVVPDAIEYYAYWYDIIGFKLAMGKTFDEIKKDLAERIVEKPEWNDEYTRLIEITNWLDENFVANAWAEIGKR